MPNLAILSTVKHLKYSMKYADLRCGVLKTNKICFECSICIKFSQCVTKAMFVIVVFFFCGNYSIANIDL